MLAELHHCRRCSPPICGPSILSVVVLLCLLLYSLWSCDCLGFWVHPGYGVPRLRLWTGAVAGARRCSSNSQGLNCSVGVAISHCCGSDGGIVIPNTWGNIWRMEGLPGTATDLGSTLSIAFTLAAYTLPYRGSNGHSGLFKATHSFFHLGLWFDVSLQSGRWISLVKHIYAGMRSMFKDVVGVSTLCPWKRTQALSIFCLTRARLDSLWLAYLT
jgi:hypothetical protein